MDNKHFSDQLMEALLNANPWTKLSTNREIGQEFP